MKSEELTSPNAVSNRMMGGGSSAIETAGIQYAGYSFLCGDQREGTLSGTGKAEQQVG